MPSARRWRLLAAVVLLATVMPPRIAWAIPSPEVILSTASGLGWLFAGLLGLAGATAGIPRGSRRGWGGAATGLLATALVVGALLAVQRVALETEARRIEHEFRCDVGYHEQRNDADLDWRVLVERGRIRYEAPTSFAALAAQSNTHVVAVDLRLPLWVESGHLAAPDVQVVGHQTHLAELGPALAAGLAEASRQRRPAILLLSTQRPNPLMYFDATSRASLSALLEGYQQVHVMVVGEFLPGHPAYDGATWLVGDPAAHARTGVTVRANPAAARAWPVLPEGLLVDAAAVWHAAFDRVLSTRQLASALDNPNVVVVAPYAGFYRDGETYLEEFVAPLLPDFPSERIVAVDYSATDIRARLAALGPRLGDRPWVIVGVSKFDTVHYGLDVLFATSDAHDGFLGWSSDLGGAAALRAVRLQARRAALPRWVALPVASAFARAGEATVSRPIFWIGWGIVGALCLLPAGIRMERQSQMIAWLESDSAAAEARNRRALLATQGALVRAYGSGAAAWIALAVLLTGGLFVLAVASVVPAWTGARVAVSPAVLAAGLGLASLLDGGASRDSWRLRRPEAWVLRLGKAVLYAILPWLLPAAVACALLGAVVVRALTGVGMTVWTQRCADRRDGLPDKAGRLQDAAAILSPVQVAVPRSHAVLPTDSPPRWCARGLMAVRSSAAGEDGSETSHAGAYLTLLNVRPASLRAAIQRVVADYPAAGGRVLVQRMVPGRLALTVFSQDPSCDAFLVVETSAQVDGALVQGTARDVQTWRLSRVSGRWSPPPLGPLAVWLDQAAAIALLLERRWQTAVDLELLVAARGARLFLLQARPVTVAAQDAGLSEDDYAALAEVNQSVALVPSPWREQCQELSRPMVAVLTAFSGAGGAMGAGWADVAVRLDGGRPVIWNGHLYATPTETRWSWGRRATFGARSFSERFEALRHAAAALDAAPLTTWEVEWQRFSEIFSRVFATTAWTDSMRRRARSVPPVRPFAARAPSPTAQWLQSRQQRADRWRHRATVDLDVGVARDGELAGLPVWPLQPAPWYRDPAPPGTVQAPRGPLDRDTESPWNWEEALDWLRDVSHDLGARAIARFRHVIALQNGRAMGADDALCLATGAIKPTTAQAPLPLGDRSWTWQDLDDQLCGGLPVYLVGGGPIAGVPVLAARLGEGVPPPDGAWVLVSESMTPMDVALAVGATAWVVARGNALSHAAIVARERRLPVICLSRPQWELVASAGQVHIAVQAGRVVVDVA